MEYQNIDIDKLKPHPKNPRLIMREDVVEGIVAGIKEGFHPANSLIVWPENGLYIILAGHHRLEAAKRAGLKELPCWVRDDIDEDAAYMLLATDNNQGELSPLEIGMHTLNYIDKSVGGRGQKGGLSEYARVVGKAESTLRFYKEAANVATNIAPECEVSALLDKAKHLSAIHALPETCWPDAVSLMLKKGWSAKETSENVKAAKEGQTEKQVSGVFLGKTNARELGRISSVKETVLSSLDFEDLKDQWLSWFNDEDPIDIKVVQAKRIELEDINYERMAEAEEKKAQAEKDKIAQERQKLPSLVLADPPWKYDFSSTDSRQIENQYPSATIEEIINHKPETQPDCILFLWATSPKLLEAIEVMESWGFKYKTHAVWNKGKIGMGYWFRGQHELLLVGTKGKASPPDAKNRVSSVFLETRKGHSEKPTCVYEWIEKAFPACKKLEMYCRKPRPNWITWGNES